MSDDIENDERILRALTHLGMSPEEIKLYLYLITRGLATIDEIPLAIPHKIINAVESLKRKGWIKEEYRGSEKVFIPVDPYYLIGTEIDKLKVIISDLEYTLNELKKVGSFGILQSFPDSDSFYKRLRISVNRSKREVDILTSEYLLPLKIFNSLERAVSRGVLVRIIGGIPPEKIRKEIEKMISSGIDIRIKSHTVLRYIIIDSEEIFIAVRNPSDIKEHLGVWINSKEFLMPLKETFENLWREAQPFE